MQRFSIYFALNVSKQKIKTCERLIELKLPLNTYTLLKNDEFRNFAVIVTVKTISHFEHPI